MKLRFTMILLLIFSVISTFSAPVEAARRRSKGAEELRRQREERRQDPVRIPTSTKPADPSFFTLNPYPGYEYQTYGFKMVGGWMGTAKDVLDAKNKPFAKFSIEWDDRWMEGNVRFIPGITRNFITLNLMHEVLIEEEYPFSVWFYPIKFNRFKVDIVDHFDKVITTLPMAPDDYDLSLMSFQPIMKGHTYRDLKLLPEYELDIEGSFWTAKKNNPLGYPPHGVHAITKNNISAIRKFVQGQQHNTIYIRVAIDPNDIQYMSDVLKDIDVQQISFGASMWSSFNNVTYASALKESTDLTKRLKEEHNYMLASYSALSLITEPLFNKGIITTLSKVSSFLPFNSIAHGEYKLLDVEYGQYDTIIGKSPRLKREPHRNQYDRNFPDVIYLDKLDGSKMRRVKP